MMVLISGLLAIPSCIYLEDLGLFRRRSLKRALEWAKQDSIRVADSLKRFELVKNSDEVIPGDSLEDKRGKNGFFESIKTKHYIIVGSFTNASNAGLCARKYLSKGFKTETIIRNGSNIELVSVRSFENILDAKKYLSEFQHDVDSAAWVYSQN
jgi:hypothetical protein